MTELFFIAGFIESKYELLVIKRYSVSDLDVKCLCGEMVEIREYDGICESCGRNFCGPLKRS